MSVLYKIDNDLDELYNFYYCPACNKFTKNVDDVVISLYCPNCLFDVPSLSLTQDLGKCTRTCLCCPLCSVTLSVYKNKLICCYCNYQYLEFEKSTGIGGKILKATNDSAFVKQFEKRKQNLKDIHSFQSKPNRYKLSKGPISDDLEFPLREIDATDDEKMTFLLKTTYSNNDQVLFNIPDANQSAQISYYPIFNSEYKTNFLPERIRLKTKRDILCQCGFTLTKLEPKVNQTMPTVSFCANQYLPRALIYKKQDDQVLIRLTNTQNNIISLTIHYQESKFQVTLNALAADEPIPNDPVPNFMPNSFMVFGIEKYWCWIQSPVNCEIKLNIEFKYGDEDALRKAEFEIVA
eukprot:NODE_43_length_33755_cov_1.178542.p11 type:complete len:350 gc:universal NODE_43_length_33755_cov_1.178542:21270-20221(-)